MGIFRAASRELGLTDRRGCRGGAARLFGGRALLMLFLLALGQKTLAKAVLEVRVTPKNKALSSNIEGYLGDLGGRDGAVLQAYTGTAKQQATLAAEALGYYQAAVVTRVEPGSPAKLLVLVQSGEPVRLRKVDIQLRGEARDLKKFQLPKGEGLRPGDQLNHGNYEGAKSLIESQASRYGFFAGRFTRKQLTVDPKGGWADIDLMYDSGPRYRLGEVSFTGNNKLDDKLLQRVVEFQPGTPYDSALIAKLDRDLRSMGYFQSVRVDALPKRAHGQTLPVTVNLAMRKPRSLDLGVGFSTDVGPRVKGNWTRHWRNAQGHSYGFESELSAPRQNIGVYYDIPRDPPDTSKLRLAAGYQYEKIADDDSLSRLLTLGPEWHKEFSNGWKRVLSLKWLREEYELGNDSGLANLLMPGASFSLLRSDNRLDPNKGYRLQFAVAGAKEGLLSDFDLVHADATVKGLTTLWQRHRFLGRLEVGGNYTSDYSSVPPSQRFFAGGDQSVRGYVYQKLSPQNDRGDYIGGRYLVAGSAEYQYSIAQKWRIAAFVDKGNSFSSLDFPSLRTGIGFGVRYLSPVGPIRVDLARGMEDGSIRLHFTMGPEL